MSKLPYEWALEELASGLGLSAPLRSPHYFENLRPEQVDEFVRLALVLEEMDTESCADLSEKIKAIASRHLGAKRGAGDA